MDDNKRKLAHACLFYEGTQTQSTERINTFIFDALTEGGYKGDEELLKRRISDNALADVMLIDNEEASIKIEDIRGMQSFLSLKPLEFSCKFAVIKNAEKMTLQAQNAILKTLEEVNNDRYILLSSKSCNELIPTVLSRLQKIKLDETSSYKELDDDTKSNLVNMLEEVLLAGNVEALFNFSDYLIKTKSEISSYLYYLYCVFGQIISYNQKVGDINRQLRLLSVNINSLCAERCIKHIKKAMFDIKGNASVAITTEAMLINLREEYYAENSRNQV